VSSWGYSLEAIRENENMRFSAHDILPPMFLSASITGLVLPHWGASFTRIIPMKLSDMKHTSNDFVKLTCVLVRFVDQDETKFRLAFFFLFIKQYLWSREISMKSAITPDTAHMYIYYVYVYINVYTCIYTQYYKYRVILHYRRGLCGL
jgi:hypothetical protein